MTEKRYKSIGANLKCSNGREYMLVKRNDGWNVCQVCSKHTAREIVDELNSLAYENEQLKRQNQEYKAILQDMGMLRSDEEVIDIRNEIADKFLKPLFKENGFDVDINTDKGFTIIPKGDVE